MRKIWLLSVTLLALGCGTPPASTQAALGKRYCADGKIDLGCQPASEYLAHVVKSCAEQKLALNGFTALKGCGGEAYGMATYQCCDAKGGGK